MSETIYVTITEEGDTTVDIEHGEGTSCEETQAIFDKLGKTTRHEKKKEYYKQPVKNRITHGK